MNNMKFIDLEKLVEKLKTRPDNAIAKEVEGWNILEKDFVNALTLNGTVKRFRTIKQNEKETIFVIRSEVIFSGYILFVLIKNSLNENELQNNSKLAEFKEIFAKPNKDDVSNNNLAGLHNLIRNSIAHGDFSFEDNGCITFRDRKKTITVETYEFIRLCEQIERFYLHIGASD